MATNIEDFNGPVGTRIGTLSGWILNGPDDWAELSGTGQVNALNGSSYGTQYMRETGSTNHFVETVVGTGQYPGSSVDFCAVKMRGEPGYPAYTVSHSATYGVLHLRDGGYPITEGYAVESVAGKTIRTEVVQAADNLTCTFNVYLDGVLVIGPVVHAFNEDMNGTKCGFAAGNEGYANAIDKITTGALVADVANPTLTGAITVTAKGANYISVQGPEGSDDIGVTKREYRINGGTWTNGPSARTFSGLTQSTSYTIDYRVGDSAGKYSTTLTKTESTTTVDTTAPVLSAASVALFGATGAKGSITTTEAGPAIAVLTGTITKPTEAAVRAVPVGPMRATATLATGVNTDVFVFTGPGASSAAYMHVLQDDLASPTPNTSLVATAGTPVVTPAPPADSTKTYTAAPGASIHAGKIAPVARKIAGADFVLQNWGSVSSPTLHRGGTPFVNGDVPPMHYVEVRRAGGAAVASQFDRRATWKNKSQKFAVMSMRDTAMAIGESRTYEFWVVPGKFDNTSAKTLASVAAALPLTCEGSLDKTWDDVSSVTRGSGAFFASFATHAAVPTRAEKIHSGPVCDGWRVWGMVKDGAAGAGAADAHLKTVWYVDAWKDAAGVVLSYEHCAVMTQDWWSVPGKVRRDYTLTYKNGGTTVATYPAVQHAYHSQWATLRLQNDNNHAKRHWTGSAPTLVYKPGRAYWIKTKLIPPYDLSLTVPGEIYEHDGKPAGIVPGTYGPGSPVDHKPDVNDYGGYMGRSMLPDSDGKAFMRQTPENIRIARANAMAGLSFPGHYRDPRSDGADVSNKIIPLICHPKPNSYSQVPGMPAPKHAYRGGHSESQYLDDWVETTGGQSQFAVNSYMGDMSHGTNYCSYMYMLEGEDFLLQAIYDLASNTASGLNANMGGGTPQSPWALNPYSKKEMSAPSTLWSACGNFTGQERGTGLAANIYGQTGLGPDDDPQAKYAKLWLSHLDDYMREYIRTTPPSARRAGLSYFSTPAERAAWQTGFGVQGCYQAARINELPSFHAFAEMLSAMLAGLLQKSLHGSAVDRAYYLKSHKAYSLENSYLPAADFLFPPDYAKVHVNGGVVSTEGIWRFPITNGDKFYFYEVTWEVRMPDGYEGGTTLYAINAENEMTGPETFQRCQVSLTPGGAPVVFPNGSYEGAFELQAFLDPNLPEFGIPPYTISADSYPALLQAGVAIAEMENSPHIVPGTTARLRHFLKDFFAEHYPGWALFPPAP